MLLLDCRGVGSVIAFCLLLQLSAASDWTASFAVVEYSSAAEAERTVVAMETSHHMLQVKFCAPGETGTNVFNRLSVCKVHSSRSFCALCH